MTLASHKLLRPRTPEWVEYLNQRMPGETAHPDDKFFHGPTPGGTAVTPSGSVTWSTRYGVLSANPDNQSSADLAGRMYALSATSAPKTIETRGRLLAKLDASPMWGLVFSDGVTTGSAIGAAGIYQSNNAAVTINAYFTGTFTTAAVNNVWGDLDPSWVSMGLYLRLVYTAANTFAWAMSLDGVNWTDFDAATFAATVTPTHFGVYTSTWSQPYTAPVTFDYIRVYDADLSV